MRKAAPMFEGVNMAKVMMGERAFQIPLNLIVQPYADGVVTGVFQTQMGEPLTCGSKRTHILLLGDMIYRPRLAIGSDEFRGRGLASLCRDGFVDTKNWLAGDILLPPLDGKMPG
jgi:hypothetical protein